MLRILRPKFGVTKLEPSRRKRLAADIFFMSLKQCDTIVINMSFYPLPLFMEEPTEKKMQWIWTITIELW